MSIGNILLKMPSGINSIIIDGTLIRFRYLFPEDVDLWIEFISRCSDDSVYSRFFHSIETITYAMATHFCNFDRDLEIAVIAEIDTDTGSQIIGEGRVVRDPANTKSEIAVLVEDEWQGKRIGTHLFDFCVGIAKDWGTPQVFALTTSRNSKMINILKRANFEVSRNPGELEVEGILELK